ncbi:hypothetical protein [Moraxella bovoculi]|uniref:hypothetical protein n=1 Tax=Moraxella bovoculi TaxID=386891 RepID=UPI000624D69F|nr:hypothetical protein [Moraxella bovoculi]AKG13472.1 hypothetical protein AAX11_04840 [Moraxella bovoculi]
MTDLILYLYLIDVIGSIAFSTKAIAVISIIILFFIVVYLFSEASYLDRDDVKHIANKYCKPIVIALTLTSLMLAVIPSKQTMYIALGLHTANQVLQHPQMVEVGNQAMRILQAKLEEYEKELAKENIDD